MHNHHRSSHDRKTRDNTPTAAAASTGSTVGTVPSSRSSGRLRQSSRWWAEMEVQVQFYDLDPMAIVWHGNYVNYLETVRCALLDKIGYNYNEMKDSGYAWPVVDLHLRYIAPAIFGQRLTLRADIVEWENRLKIDYLICDTLTGKRLHRASTIQVAVELARGEMCYVSPPALLTKLGVS